MGFRRPGMLDGSRRCSPFAQIGLKVFDQLAAAHFRAVSGQSDFEIERLQLLHRWVTDSTSIRIGKLHTVKTWHSGTCIVAEEFSFSLAQDLQICYIVKDVIDKTANHPIAIR